MGLGDRAGPLKPALERVFGPMGYSCKGGSGTFTLRRRTATNLDRELSLDVGTWSHSTIGIFRVLGVGFKASLLTPVKRACRGRRAISYSAMPSSGRRSWRTWERSCGSWIGRRADIERAAGPSPSGIAGELAEPGPTILTQQVPGTEEGSHEPRAGVTRL